MNIVIKQGNILTMAGKNYNPGDVLITEGKIVRVAERIDSSEYSSSHKIIDATGLTVIPGFVESHSHIGISEERKGQAENDCNESTQPVTPQLRGLDAINPMDSAFSKAIKAGITSVMVGPGSSNVVGGQFVFMKTGGSRRIDDLVVLEPAAMKIAFGENPKTQFGGKDVMPTTRMGIAAMLREELFRASNYYKAKCEAEQNNESFDIDFSLECWVPVFKKEIPAKAHVHEAYDILTVIRIAKEFDIDITLDHCTEGHLIAKEIKESGFPAIVGPSLASRSKIEIENLDFKTSGVLHDAGVLVSITTDHPVSLIQSLPTCAGLAAKNGLGVENALRAITIDAAKICRVDNRVGSIEAGKDADIAIFDGNPLELFSHCVYTIIDGNIVNDTAEPHRCNCRQS